MFRYGETIILHKNFNIGYLTHVFDYIPIAGDCFLGFIYILFFFVLLLIA